MSRNKDKTRFSVWMRMKCRKCFSMRVVMPPMLQYQKHSHKLNGAAAANNIMTCLFGNNSLAPAEQICASNLHFGLFKSACSLFPFHKNHVWLSASRHAFITWFSTSQMLLMAFVLIAAMIMSSSQFYEKRR